MRFSSRPLLLALAPLCFAAACGGDVFTVADADDGADGIDGSDSEDGTDSNDGSDSSGSGGDVSGTGGGTIADNCGNNFKTDCEGDDDCVVAVDVCDRCYSAECASPAAASKRNTITQGCLRTWDRRTEGPSDKCELGPGVGCPAICAEPPPCPTSTCVDGQCILHTDDASCGSTGGTTGAGGTTASGGNSTGSGGLTAAGGFISEPGTGSTGPIDF